MYFAKCHWCRHDCIPYGGFDDTAAGCKGSPIVQMLGVDVPVGSAGG